ncbi:MAG: hypothetical protein ABFC89_05935 [Methanospirillum sp.]
MSTEVSLKVSMEVKSLLDGLKVHPRESYSDVIGRVTRQAYNPEPLSAEEIAALDPAARDRIATMAAAAPGAPVYLYPAGRFRALVQVLDDRLAITVIEGQTSGA